MRLCHSSIRFKISVLILVPLLSLVGLYAFATAITAQDAIVLARSATVKNSIGEPAGHLEEQIDVERLLATVFLAWPTPQNRAAFDAQVTKTNRAVSLVRAAATSAAVQGTASPQTKSALTA